MLEEKKEWIKEKIKKGKEWAEDNKFIVGYISGALVYASLTYLSFRTINKIFETKSQICQIYSGDESKDGDVDFAIGIVEVDRFKRKRLDPNKILLLNEECKNELFKQIEDAIEYTKEKRNIN